MSLEQTVKSKDKNSAPSDEDADRAGLLHNAPTETYELPWKSTLSPSDFTTSVSSSKYSELDPVVKMEIGTTTKINNNVPFKERNTPFHKAIISPCINNSTKDTLNTILIMDLCPVIL